MSSLFLRFLVLFACLTCLQAREVLPSWVQESLVPVAQTSKTGLSHEYLLMSCRVEFLEAGRVRRTERRVVRMLTDDGLNAAMTSQDYWQDHSKITQMQAWVIAPDGKTSQTFGRKAFSDQTSASKQFFLSIREVHFMRTDLVKVGGVLAWEYVREEPVGLANASWSFLSGSRIQRSFMEVTGCAGGQLVWQATGEGVPEPQALSGGGLRWELTALDPGPKERPSGFSPNPRRVDVRCVQASLPITQIKDWTDYARFTSEVYEQRLPAAAPVTKKAAELSEGHAKRWDRVRAISEFAQKEILYLALSPDTDAMRGHRPRWPAEVLSTKLGDCKDKALLMVSMLRSLGDKAYVVLVYAGNPAAVRAEWPGPLFNHAIVAIPADDSVPSDWPVVEVAGLGRQVLFDATDPGTPLGVLTDRDQGGLGLVISEHTPGLVQMPVETPEDKRLTRKIRVRAAKDNFMRVELQDIHTGSSGAREHFALSRQKEGEVRKLLESRLHRVSPSLRELGWKQEWDPRTSTNQLSIDFEAGSLLRVAGNELLLFRPALIPLEIRYDEWKAALKGTVWLPAMARDEELRMDMPAGLEIESMPSAYKDSLGGSVCEVSYAKEEGQLVFRCRLEQRGCFLDRQAYEAQRQFWKKAGDAVKRPWILRRQAAP